MRHTSENFAPSDPLLQFETRIGSKSTIARHRHATLSRYHMTKALIFRIIIMYSTSQHKVPSHLDFQEWFINEGLSSILNPLCYDYKK